MRQSSKSINILCILLHTLLISISANESDHMALLDFKNRVLNDPLGITHSWNDSTHFCNWVGVKCNPNTKTVMGLDLQSQKLTASIPTSMANMTHLTHIKLGDNQFHGHIPQQLGQLQHLQHLNLSYNNFTGQIPSNLSHCIKLVVLEFGMNMFEGQIPHQFFKLTKLETLGFGSNNMIGTIPSWVSNLSSLSSLSFMTNNFHGTIPNEFGLLTRLKFLSLASNFLTGKIPPSIYNLTSLTDLYLTLNQLDGILPENIGFTLPHLRFLAIGSNNFRGSIPKSLANISKLQALDFPGNHFTGLVPNELGRLKHLQRLNFEDNKLGSDMNFITSLTNCTSLRALGLSRNGFGGALPSSIANFSNQLTILVMGGNKISGSIPLGIINLVNLQFLALEYNNLDGNVPTNIGNLKNLVKLLLQGNKLTGPIPLSIGNLSLITKLCLNDNRFEGSIPRTLGQCKSLLGLDLSRNRLTGVIPNEILRLGSLSVYLALDHNSLTGSLPLDVGELVSLTLFDVSKNKLSGNISSNLGKCVSLLYLDLSYNRFEGTIPQSLEALQGLEVLNLSSNYLSGPIPQFLCKLLWLKDLNLSYNNFEGQVPKDGIFSNSTMVSINGNDNLCDGLRELHLPLCKLNRSHSSKKFRAVVSVVSTVTFIVVLSSIIFVCFVLKKSRKKALASSYSKKFLPQISYSELCKSTNGFSMDNFIGSGSFGSVYKGVLPNDGSIVAIKVLNLQQQGASKSFVDECNALSNMRHRNLLKIITSCSSIDVQGNEFKALVFNFMSNGNLDHWLHPSNEGHNQRRLNLLQRLNIAIDIACGLDYLHNHCEAPIVHCDLKPSNILLDNDMVAHVGDFGLARFMMEGPNDELSSSQTMSLALKGSIGYIPPEYGTGGRISIEGDTFSYGILLLEMIIGKRPTNDMFGDGMDIHLFITTALSQGVFDMIDHSLLPEKTREEDNDDEDTIQEIAIMGEEDRREVMPKWMEKCVASMLKIGLSCSSKSPSERTSMNVVVNELISIKNCYYKFVKENQ